MRIESVKHRRHRKGSALLLCAALLLSAICLAKPLKIRVTGLDAGARQNLLAHLGSVEDGLAAQPERLRAVLARAVKDALQPLGYYEPQFEFSRAADSLRIAVQPGTRILFLEPVLRVDEPAASLPEVSGLLRAAPVARGRPLLHASHDAFRDDLLRSCRRLGFFDAAYRHAELRIDPVARTARSSLDLACGRRYEFGPLELSGSRIEPALLESLAPFRAGDPFDGALVARFERRLRDTGFFRNLALRVMPEPDRRVRIEVLAEDIETSRYEIGAGFSTDSALRLRFNRHTPLMNSEAHSLRIESELSEPRQAVEAVYRIPHHDPLDDIVEFTAGMQGKRVQDNDTKTASAGVRHVLQVLDDWSYVYGASAEIERYTVGSATEKDVAYLMPATSISRTRLEPGIDPLHGSAYWGSVDFSDRVVGSPADFLRWRASGKWLFSFADRNTTVLARLELGAIIADGFNNLPGSVRFYAGGDNSIRGYDFESLGPRDDFGKLIGGRYLAVGGLEVSRRVRPRWRVAAFMDGGGAFNEKHDTFNQSIGVGLRWLSPIGQIRADLAMPFKDSENSGFKLHISMGPPL